MKYDYRKYKSKTLTVEQMDKLIDLVLASPSSKFMAVANGIKLIVFSVAVFARQRIVDAQIEIDKAEYEMQRSERNSREVDNVSFSSM
jgi:hypothetical protein